MAEHDNNHEPTGPVPGAPLIDPAGEHYWDGHAWQPLPTARSAQTPPAAAQPVPPAAPPPPNPVLPVSPAPVPPRPTLPVPPSPPTGHVGQQHRAESRPGGRPRRALLVTAVVVVVVLVAATGAGAWVWYDRAQQEAAREAAYRDALEHMIKGKTSPLTDAQFEGALAMGRDACEHLESGMTYEDTVDLYGPDSDVFPSDTATAGDWIDQAAPALAQLLTVTYTVAAAQNYLCPDTQVTGTD